MGMTDYEWPADAGCCRHDFTSRNLRLSYVDWGNPAAPLLLLLHGGLEHARCWDRIADALRERWHVVAPDLRGHGESDWSSGGAYSVLDHAADVAALARHLGARPASLIGHSLGGNVAIHFAALFPEFVERLCVIEGLGLSPKKRAERDRVSRRGQLRQWVDRVAALSVRTPRRYADIAAAAARIRDYDPRLDIVTAEHIARHGVELSAAGGLQWKYDELLRAPGAADVASPGESELWAAIECPTQLIYGAESWASNPALDGRARLFSNAEVVVIDAAGHNVHHHQPAAFLARVTVFLERAGAAAT